MFDTFDIDYFSDSFFEEEKDCIHEWETIEFSVFKDKTGNPLAKKKRCIRCGDRIWNVA